MNERIIELAYKVVSEADIDMNIPPEFYDKFAKLIVRECADLFDKNETEVKIPEHRIHDSIMIHFGLY